MDDAEVFGVVFLFAPLNLAFSQFLLDRASPSESLIVTITKTPGQYNPCTPLYSADRAHRLLKNELYFGIGYGPQTVNRINLTVIASNTADCQGFAFFIPQGPAPSSVLAGLNGRLKSGTRKEQSDFETKNSHEGNYNTLWEKLSISFGKSLSILLVQSTSRRQDSKYILVASYLACQ